MGCSSSAQARNVERTPQPIQVAAAQTAANQGGSETSPQANVAPTKPVKIDSTTTAENNQVVNDQKDAPSTGN